MPGTPARSSEHPALAAGQGSRAGSAWQILTGACVGVLAGALARDLPTRLLGWLTGVLTRNAGDCGSNQGLDCALHGASQAIVAVVVAVAIVVALLAVAAIAGLVLLIVGARRFRRLERPGRHTGPRQLVAWAALSTGCGLLVPALWFAGQVITSALS